MNAVRPIQQSNPRGSSERLDVLGPGTFWSTAFGIVDLLPFVELLERGSLNGGHVEEQLLSTASRDEAESFFRQLFDRSCGITVSTDSIAVLLPPRNTRYVHEAVAIVQTRRTYAIPRHNAAA